MAELATIARPYAEAAFGLADQAGTLPAWSEALGQLAAAGATPELQQVLGDPVVSAQQLVDALLAVASGAPAEIERFLQTLAENKRLAVLPAIRDQFEQLRAEREGTLDAKIESAFPFSEEQLASLVEDLQRRFGRRIRAEVVHDPELLGGAKITVGDRVIDGSVRGKLSAIAAGLAGA